MENRRPTMKKVRETLDEQIPRILHGSKRHLHVPFRFELPGAVEKVFENGGRYRD